VTNGIGDDSAFGAVTPPLYLSSNFTFEGFERPRQYDYTRSGNPTRDLLADTIAQLEGGAGAVVVSTGMAAVDLSIASLEPGDLIVAPHDCYAGTWRLLNARRAKRQFDVAFIDINTIGLSFCWAYARKPPFRCHSGNTNDCAIKNATENARIHPVHLMSSEPAQRWERVLSGIDLHQIFPTKPERPNP
jgi:hypothetical protein